MSLKKAYLELTSKCNLDCTICYRRTWNDLAFDMGADIYERAINEIKQISTLEHIVLGGIGEPTYAPLFLKALEELKELNITLTTNGVYSDDNISEAIAKYANQVIVSIDGLGDIYSQIRGEELDKVIQNIKDINKFKKEYKSQFPRIGLQMVITKENSGEILALIDLADELKAEMLVISNLIPQSQDNKDKILYTRYGNDKVKGIINKAMGYSFRKGIKIVLPNWELKTERRCNFIDENTTYITVFGEVVPCYRFSHTFKEFVFGREKTVIKHTFGNIKEQGLQDIWDSREYKNFRQRIENNKYPSCIDCDLVEGCDLVNDTQGDCHANTPSCGDCLWSRKFVICP